jgi:transcriptional regulator NrdR family protein
MMTLVQEQEKHNEFNIAKIMQNIKQRNQNRPNNQPVQDSTHLVYQSVNSLTENEPATRTELKTVELGYNVMKGTEYVVSL